MGTNKTRSSFSGRWLQNTKVQKEDLYSFPPDPLLRKESMLP